jgi:hypothetical protein
MTRVTEINVGGGTVTERDATPEEEAGILTPATGGDERDTTEETRALKAAARLDVTDRLRSDALDQATIEAVAGIYDPWEPRLAVTVGQVLRWDGTLVEVLQAHTTQADWTPDVVPALFRVYRAPGSVAAWVQPTGGHDAYQIGERVTHPNAQDGGRVWIFESAINANTTEPGRDGTFHRWWTPIEPA